MKHFTVPSFWDAYNNLPEEIQNLADSSYFTLKENPKHPSLHFKKVGQYRSIRIGMHYRALAVEVDEGFLWFWIGTHAEYDKLLKF